MRKLLYLAHYYPPVPQRFLADEIMRWRRLGIPLDVLAIRAPATDRLSLMTPEIRQEVETTTYLSSLDVKTWVSGLIACLEHPLKAARILVRVATARYPCVGGWRLRAHSILTAIRSIAVMGHISAGSYAHVHCDFADDTATMALIAHRVTGVSFSFRDYFSFNSQLIEEKATEADLVIACSERNRDRLLESSRATTSDHVITDYLGVHLDQWPPCVLPSDARIVSVGNLQEKKGHLYLIRSMAELQADGIEAFCTLVGDGDLREQLETEIDELGLRDHVEITGYVGAEGVREALGRARIFCLPAVIALNGDTDGVPFVLMEAMAMGRPCVSTAVGGIDEILRDGREGFIVPQRDPRSLADALKALLDDSFLVESMSRSCRHRAEELLDIDSNTQTTARYLARNLEAPA